MIRNFDKKLNWDVKYIPNFRVVQLIGPRQLEFSNPTDRLRKVNVCGIHKILPSDQIVNPIPKEQFFGSKGKYIGDPHILKGIAIIDAFLHETFPNVRIKPK